MQFFIQFKSRSVYLKHFIKRKFIQMSKQFFFSLLQASPNHAVMTESVLEYVGRASISSAISCTEINNQQYQIQVHINKYISSETVTCCQVNEWLGCF